MRHGLPSPTVSAAASPVNRQPMNTYPYGTPSGVDGAVTQPLPEDTMSQCRKTAVAEPKIKSTSPWI
ncbi:hypothetical protein D3C85_1899460 [compost metagenome]